MGLPDSEAVVLWEMEGREEEERERERKKSERSVERSRSKGTKKKKGKREFVLVAVSVALSSPLLRSAFRKKESTREIKTRKGTGERTRKEGEANAATRASGTCSGFLFYFWPSSFFC